MLCVYFEIPYERQLLRIAPFEIQKLFNAVAESAEANGATSFKISCASIYCFSSSELAPVFSANLFLQNLADLLRVYRRRIVDYRVIIDCCGETDSEDTITDHFAAYRSILVPNRSFFASPEAERLLQSYIRFEYVSKIKLYYSAEFIVPKTINDESAEKPCSIYLTGTVTWLHALYHFMLLHPVTGQAVAEVLSDSERAQFDKTKHVQYYFSRNRFCSDYPDYFIDAFLLYTQLYFRVFEKSAHITELTVIYTEENAEEANRLLNVLPIRAHTERMPEKSMQLDGLSLDFLQLAYLTIYGSSFIFEDELQEFFLSLHKSTSFITNLYEWMYAAGITAVKDDIYSASKGAVDLLEQKLGAEREKVKPYIADFLWDKYKKGMLCPDENLKDIFYALQFEPQDQFMLHYFFHKYSDKEIPQIDIGSFKNAVFFGALESYQKALKISKQKNINEAVHAVKKAVSSVQKHTFPAGEYRALSCIAFLHLSQNKIEDAVTYFQYALDIAESLNDSRFICEALFNLGISCFLQNNLHAVSGFLDRLLQASEDYFEEPKKIPCLFMQGRVALQLGDYGKAELLFQEAEKAASKHFQEWIPLCRIWYARTLSQKGQTGKAQPVFIANLDKSPDALLFLIESFLLAPIFRDERSQIQAASEIITAPVEPYQSGFALAEDLVWGHLYSRPVMEIFYTAMDSYYRFRLAAELLEDSAQTYLQVLEDTAREALRHSDMYASIYAYLCYDAILRREGSTSDTANGYLSRSFKALQNCMDMMTENTVRDKFIFRNVWNAKLYAAAQKNKLI